MEKSFKPKINCNIENVFMNAKEKKVLTWHKIEEISNFNFEHIIFINEIVHHWPIVY